MTNQDAENDRMKIARLIENRKQPAQCHLWAKDRLADEDLDCLTFVKEYMDDPHLARWLSRCGLCGQLYFGEFYEVVDWDKGDDKQYATLIPVESESEADEISELTPFQLLIFHPTIRNDSHDKSGKGIHWTGRQGGQS